MLIAADAFNTPARSLLLRILAAGDRGGGVALLTPDPLTANRFAHAPTPADEWADRLERVVLGLDLLEMHREAGTDDEPVGAAEVPGVLVVDATVLVPGERELTALHRITGLAPPAGLTLVLLAPRSALKDWADGFDAVLLPTEPVAIVDAWTQQTWRLDPDTAGPDPTLAAALVRRCTAGFRTGGA